MTFDTVSSKLAQWSTHKRQTLTSEKFWRRRLPIINFLQGYNVSMLTSDVIAGFTVALTVLPQCMAIATLAGVPPQYGLYSSFVGSFFYVIFGTTSYSTVGPTVVQSILVRPFVDKFGPQVAILLCFCSGCFITASAVLNLEFIVHFVSAPVLAGFMSAAGLSVISGQIPGLIGIPGGGETFVEYWVNIVKHIDQTKLWDTVLGVSCILVLLVLEYLYKFSEPPEGRKLSGTQKFMRGVLRYISLGRNAIVVIISTTIVYLLMQSSGGKPPVGVPGEIQEGLPMFKPPPFEVIKNNVTLTFGEAFVELLPALTIPVLALLEAISTCKLFDSGRTIDFSQEMFTVGMCNIVGSFVQSIPVAPSMTRSAVNHKSGVKTPLGGIVTGSIVLLALAFLTSTLQYLPNSTMAAVVIVAIYIIVQIYRDTMLLWRSHCRLDLLALYVTFVASLVIGLDYGMFIGIICNVLILLHGTARPNVNIETLDVGGSSLMLVTADTGVTYVAAEHVKHAITKPASRMKTDLVLIVIDGNHIQTIDSTAIKVFKSLVKESQVRNQKVIFWNWKKIIQKKFISYDLKDIECFLNAETREELMSALNLKKEDENEKQ